MHSISAAVIQSIITVVIHFTPTVVIHSVTAIWKQLVKVAKEVDTSGHNGHSGANDLLLSNSSPVWQYSPSQLGLGVDFVFPPSQQVTTSNK